MFRPVELTLSTTGGSASPPANSVDLKWNNTRGRGRYRAAIATYALLGYLVENAEEAALTLLESPHNPPGLCDVLCQLGALRQLDYNDAVHFATTIVDALMHPGGYMAFYPQGPDWPRTALALRRKAASIACGSDLRCWHDPGAVSNALGAAADALHSLTTPSRVQRTAIRRRWGSSG